MGLEGSTQDPVEDKLVKVFKRLDVQVSSCVLLWFHSALRLDWTWMAKWREAFTKVEFEH